MQQKRRAAGVSMADGGNCLERNTAGFQRLLLAPHPFNLASPSISWQRVRTLPFCVCAVVWRHSRISLEGCPDCANVVASSPERISGQRAARHAAFSLAEHNGGEIREQDGEGLKARAKGTVNG